MAEQLIRLVDAARQPTTAIEVIPATTGAHEGLTGAFIIADFEAAPTIGYREAAGRGFPVEEHDDLASLELAWATLRGETLPRRASLAILEEAAKSWTSAA